jgi:very-short-patch-repair endonuclease
LPHEKNVLAFLAQCSNEIAQQTANYFSDHILITCEENEITSPIEQYLYIALRTLARLSDVQELTADVIKPYEPFSWGLEITPQQAVGRYYVDFGVRYMTWPHQGNPHNQQIREVLVECDSQEWHERTERERRYEKQRDRFIQRAGYKIFRYTGAEILADPFKVAREILEHVLNTNDLSLAVE